jgi:DNA mismatch repair protein MutL
MGRIHVLPEHVANKIAAGEVVERPASVVKELLENALDAGARRIHIQVEAGGKKLIKITDDGCGMVRDDAMLAFERHATSKLTNTDDLLNISTLGFRGEALPSIASVSRVTLETCANQNPDPSTALRSARDDKSNADPSTALAAARSARDDLRNKEADVPQESTQARAPAPPDSAGTRIEIAGGKILKIEEAGLPAGTSIAVKDLFFNTPARKKFLKAESTELSHIASLVTHYALAHPDKHFELHSLTNALLVAAPVKTHAERIYQVFGKETLDQLVPLAAALPLERVGIPQPPPWSKKLQEEDYAPPVPGELRLHGFVSKPEVQKLNRNSIFVFVNGRLIRDRAVQHAITEAYRNILPPTVFPVVLLFLEMPYVEVDVNVHPSKTEVRFRQQQAVHDFVRDSVRTALMKARPVPQFVNEIKAQPTAGQALTPGARSAAAGSDFQLQAPMLPPLNARFTFDGGIEVAANAAVAVPQFGTTNADPSTAASLALGLARDDLRLGGIAAATLGTNGNCGGEVLAAEEEDADRPLLATLKPLGQIRNSFILAVNGAGLWIIDQHVAHERVLFEKILRQRGGNAVEGQRLLMPMILELTPGQQAVFTEISDELRANGFEVEPFGARTIAVKTAPAGVKAEQIEHLLHELLDHFEKQEQATNIEKLRAGIAASIACHAAIKVNMALEQNKMEWLLAELAKTEAPMSCPHGRPVVLRYSVEDIQKAFKRI